MLIILSSVIALVAALWLLIQVPAVQNWLIDKVSGKLSKDLRARIAIGHVNFSLFNKMHLENVLVEDQQKDTILSAGDISVNITDWFFFKKDIELKYIGLKDASIHLQRTDSVWRYQFLIDYFSTPSSGKKKGKVNLAFREVDLKNVHILQTDGWNGKNMLFSLASLHVHPNTVDFKNKIINIKELAINQPYIALSSYKGNKPPGSVSAKDIQKEKKKDTATLQWNIDRWQILAGNVNIRNGHFKTDNNSQLPDSTRFDGKHIDFTSININLNGVKWWMDTITTSIQLNTKERSGLIVKKLAANAKFTPHEMTFNHLDLQTNDSYLKDYFSMQFDGFESMANFVENVRLEGDLNHSIINSDDIAFFAPSMKTWKKKINISGKIRGPVAALNGKGLEILAGGKTYFSGDASLTGLPNINETFIDINAKSFKTIYSDALAFVPQLKNVQSPNIAQLKYVNFTGSFTGFIRDFVTYGTIQTALGTVKTDVNMKIPQQGFPVYSGNVFTSSFLLGPLLKDTLLGYVSIDAKLKGAGFNPTSGNIALAAKVPFVDFNGYRYHNIDVDGEANKNIFNGTININDPNADLALNGLIDFNNENPLFNFTSDIRIINFQLLNLYKENIALSGNITARFTGKSIDDFLGDATVLNAHLSKDGSPLSFDSLAIHTAMVDSLKQLTINSNEFSVKLQGIYNIRDLGLSVTGFLHNYYPSYIKEPSRQIPDQVFSFEVTTQNFDSFLPLIDTNLSGLNNSIIRGSINTNSSTLQLDASVPTFGFSKYTFNEIDIAAKGSRDSIHLNGQANNVTIGDSLSVPLVVFNIATSRDVSNVTLFSGGNKTVDRVSLDAVVTTYNDGVKINFNPSSFVLNNKTWSINRNGEWEFRKSVQGHGEILLKESTQVIRIITVPAKNGNSNNNIAVQLRDFNVGDISPYLLPANRLEGIVSADVLLENPGKDMRISSENFSGKAIQFDNDSIGDLQAHMIFDLPTKELTIEGKTLHPQKKDLAFNVHLYLKNQETQQNNVIKLNADQFNIKHINRFLSFLFSDMQGEITGNFQLKGPFNRLNITGKGKLHNAGLRVNFTQCFYRVEDNDVVLDENEINVDKLVLIDSVTKNPIYLQGSILHNSFKNMFFDITVSTRKPGTTDREHNLPVQVLNTTMKDNKVFYGNVKATGSFSLIGPEENVYMKIDAIAAYNTDSYFNISSPDKKATQMPDWLVQQQYGTTMVDTLNRTKSKNVIYDLDVTANPRVEMRFVMDDLTGDEIKGRGSGTLNIRSGTSEPLTIRGRYDIEEGSYNYTFQSFFKKPFELKKGTENYISWNGDPTKANINFEAQYKAERVSFAPLARLNIDQSYASARENVLVNAKLTGELFKPDFDFSLELDQNSAFRNDFNISNALQQIIRNPTEVTRQVTYLIVFNSFAPPETGVNNPGLGAAVNEFTYSTISSLSGLFFNEINAKLNNELSKILGSNVRVVFGGSVYNRNLLNVQSSDFKINQANFNGAVLVPLFNDRFVISLGSSLEVPLQSSLQQTVQFLPDVTAEWLLNPSGRIRLNFFYRENFDYITSASSGAAKLKRTGGGLSFRREFDNLRELFTNVRRRTKRELQRATQQQNAGEDSADKSTDSNFLFTNPSKGTSDTLLH